MQKKSQKSNSEDKAVLSAIENLALATGQGFEDVRKQFKESDERMDRRFEKVHQDIEALRLDVKDVQSEVARMQAILIKDLQRRVEVLEAKTR